MRLVSVHGDVVDVAPMLADAALLWVSTGFSDRRLAWDRFSDAHQRDLRHVAPPWQVEEDVFIELAKPDRRLHWLYFLANPRDRRRCESLERLVSMVNEALTRLSRAGARSVALIHIPVEKVTADHAAKELLWVLKTWSRRHPTGIDTAFLVDLKDGFRKWEAASKTKSRRPRR
jgi:hypothetical protein